MKRIFLLLLISLAQLVNANSATAQTTDTTLNRPAPDFKLKDINGKTVSLADYKGKVLVIDFWATWCVPCRYSFPAAKMAVEKYKNDPNVKFLFIDTREKTDNYRQLAKNFMANNHYPFHVVFDEKSKSGRIDTTFKRYTIPGIPAKFFIDGNGIIRYKMVGYFTNESTKEAAEDIEDYIEKIKVRK